MILFPGTPGRREYNAGGSRYFGFFGATPESWIGKIWPRGRAHQNELSTATLADNFCNGWSGGVNFLQYRHAGSEVSIEPNGNVFPCCMKTQLAIGNLLSDKLEKILDRLIGNPAYEAISMGHSRANGYRTRLERRQIPLGFRNYSSVGPCIPEPLRGLPCFPPRRAHE